jgi:hypothetical protein
MRVCSLLCRYHPTMWGVPREGGVADSCNKGQVTPLHVGGVPSRLYRVQS